LFFISNKISLFDLFIKSFIAFFYYLIIPLPIPKVVVVPKEITGAPKLPTPVVVTPIPNGITTFTTDSFNKALITSSIIINIIASLVFGPSANTSPVTIPASDCLDIILDKIDSDDSPGLKFEPNNINGGW
jgi:hypothetical protein